MSTKIELTPLQVSLLLLTLIENQIGVALNVLIPEENLKNKDLLFTVCNHLQILLCSFLKEWRKLGKELRENGDENTLRITSPYLHRIQGWEGLFAIRNTLLCHGGRDSNNNPVWAWDVFDEHNAPTNFAETILLGKCALKAIEKVKERNQSEYKKAEKESRLQRKTPERKGIKEKEEVRKELERLNEEMAQIEKKLLEQS